MTSLLVATPSYPAVAQTRTHSPRKARPYHEYRDCLRLEFGFSCVYRLANEREVSPTDKYGGFEVEHFRPKGSPSFKHLRNYYPNLLWSCHACNRAKGDEWPSPSELAQGFRFVDPIAEPLGAHLAIAGDKVESVGSGPAGEYMIEQINLNSKQHVERRRRRRELMKAFATLEATAEVLRQRIVPGAANEATLHSELDTLHEAIQAQRQMTGIPKSDPWDAPAACFACQSLKTRPRKRRN